MKLCQTKPRSGDAPSLHLLRTPRLEEAASKHGEKDEQWSNSPARVANLSPQNSSE